MTKQQTKLKVSDLFSPEEVAGLRKCIREKILLNSELYYGKKVGSGITKENLLSRLELWQGLERKFE